MSSSSYIEEFLAIAGFLEQSQKVPVRNGYLLIKRQVLEKMMDRNAYDTSENKLKVWKSLHWIDTDEERFTKKVSYEGKSVRLVKIDIGVYQTLAKIVSG